MYNSPSVRLFFLKFLKISNQRHLAFAIILGLILRLIASIFSYGPQSLDDYRHGLFPAFQLAHGMDLDIPDYRNHLLVWIVGGIIYTLNQLNVHHHLYILNTVYIILSMLSLITIYGCYQLLSIEKKKSIRTISLYVFALHPLLIFSTTRILGESISISFLLLGIAFAIKCFNHLNQKTVNHVDSMALFLAGLFIGIATLFRFQLGIVYIYFLIPLVYKKKFRPLFTYLFAGCIVLLLQIGIDLLSHKPVLGTLLAYLRVNQNGAVEFGTAPWYVTWFAVLGGFLWPLSFSLFNKNSLQNFYKKFKHIIYILIYFTFIHSLIPHKEERFLFPLVPLILIVTTYLWYYSRKSLFTKFLFVPSYAIFSVSLFFMSVLSNSQESIVGPVALLSSTNTNVSYVVDIQPLFGSFGLREYFIPKKIKYLEFENVSQFLDFLEKDPSFKDSAFKDSTFTDPALEQTGSQKSDIQKSTSEKTATKTVMSVVFLKSQDDYPTYLKEDLRSHHFSCSEFVKYQSLSDYIVYSLSRLANERRKPSWKTTCQWLGSNS